MSFFSKVKNWSGTKADITYIDQQLGHTVKSSENAYEIKGGFIVFSKNEAAKSTWVKNVLVAGTASLTKDGEVYSLNNPQKITAEQVTNLLPLDNRPKKVKGAVFVQFDTAD